MHRAIFEYHNGFPVPDNMEVDHVDRNGLNNLRYNLRVCTSAQNKVNSSLHRNNTSSYKGVHWDKSRHKWYAEIGFNYHVINLGRYDDIEDAIDAYKKKAIELFGDFIYIPE